MPGEKGKNERNPERKSTTGTKYKAQKIKKKGGEFVLSKSKTLNRKPSARVWVKRIEREFDAGVFSNGVTAQQSPP